MDATPPAAPSPEGARGIPEAPSPDVRLSLFRQGTVEVTPEWMMVRGYCYPVAELSNLRTRRGPRHPFTVRTALLSTIALAGLTSVLGLVDSPVRISGRTYLSLIAALVVPMVVLLVGEMSRPRRWELWADYLGMRVRLLQTNDRDQHSQVMCALRRAMENARLGAAAGAHELAPWLSWQRMAVRR